MIGKVIKDRYRIYDQIGQGSVAAVCLLKWPCYIQERPLNVKRPSPRGWPLFCIKCSPMSDLLPLLLFPRDGLDALVDSSATQRAQDDLRCLLAQDAIQLDRGQRGVPIGQEKAKDRSSQGGLFSEVIRQLTAMGAQALPKAINFRHLGCLWIDPVNLFCLRVVGVDCLTFGAEVAPQVDAKIFALLTPPLKVNMEFSIDIGFNPFH